MKTKVITFTLLLHLVVPSIAKMEICNCPDGYQPGDVSCLTEALQAELTSTPTNIRQLQEMFYFSNNVQPFFIDTNMTVGVFSSSSSEFLPVQISRQWTHLWYEDNFLGVARKLISDISFGFSHTDPLTYFLLTPTSSSLQVNIPATLNIQLNCSASSYRGTLISIDEEVLRNKWEDILQWVSS